MIKVKVFEVMAQRGFRTRQTLSEATGIHPNSFGKVVNGKVRAVRLDILDKLCEVLDCKPGDLLDYVPNDNPKSKPKKR